MTITLICAAAFVVNTPTETTAYQRDCKQVQVQTVDVPTPSDAAAEKARIERMKKEGKG